MLELELSGRTRALQLKQSNKKHDSSPNYIGNAAKALNKSKKFKPKPNLHAVFARGDCEISEAER